MFKSLGPAGSDMEEDNDLDFESAAEKKRMPPLFENEDHGVTLWVDEDKNGNSFLRMRLPLGLGTVPVFVNDSGYDDVQDSFNRLIEHIQD